MKNNPHLQSFLPSLSEANPDTMKLLKDYAALLLKHNRVSNLVGPLDEAKLFEELLLDSLLPASVAPEAPRGPVVDLGCGAGIPGVPLAIAYPQVEFHLVEPRLKRHTFLRIVRRTLKLQNVVIHPHRFEDVDVPEKHFGTLVAKAFQPPPTLLKTASSWLRPGGRIFLYLSNQSWNEEAQSTARDLGYREIGRAGHPTHSGRFGLVMEKP